MSNRTCTGSLARALLILPGALIVASLTWTTNISAQPVYCAEYEVVGEGQFAHLAVGQLERSDFAEDWKTHKRTIITPANLCDGAIIEAGKNTWRRRVNLGSVVRARDIQQLTQRVDSKVSALTNSLDAYRQEITTAQSTFDAYRSEVSEALNNLGDEIISDAISEAQKERIREVVNDLIEDELRAEFERRVQERVDAELAQMEAEAAESESGSSDSENQ